MSLVSKDLEYVWHPYTPYGAKAPVAIVKGEGVYLFDETGKKYIDAVSSWWVNIHGHSHPYIAERVSHQLRTLEHVIFAGFTHQPAVELAERLLEIVPGKMDKVFFSDNGSTAVEVAVKMALQYWHNLGVQKKLIVSFEHSYHGDTFGSMSVSSRSSFTKAFESLLFDTVTLPFPERGKENDTLLALKELIRLKRDQIAAFIFEPLVLGAGGMLMYEPGILDELLYLCRVNGIICVADEVMTGFGRTGKLFACDYLREKPDIICLSKGITGGAMPFGVTCCNEKIHSAFRSSETGKTFFHGHSYTANPLACSAALASLELLLDKKRLDDIARISNRQQLFAARLRENNRLENIRRCGTILAFDVKTGEQTGYFNSSRNSLYDFFINEGVILRPLGNTLYVMPPYCISDEELEIVYQAIEKLIG